MVSAHESTYDCFLSYAGVDRPWVWHTLVPALGLAPGRLVTHEDFILGASLLSEFERAITQSRFTLIVFTPEYLADRWAMFGESLAAYASISQQHSRLIPIFLRTCHPSLRIDRLVRLDCSDLATQPLQLARLRAHLTASAPALRLDEIRQNPFRGLAAFQEADERLFFGREALTRKLWQTFSRLHAHDGTTRLLAVHGPSGSGKSSVVLAGLVPALKSQPVQGNAAPLVAVFTPGERPLAALALSLASLLPADTAILRAIRAQELEQQLLRRPCATGNYEGLRRFADALPNRVHLVLVIDQFEEVYSLCKDERERELFLGLLLHAIADHDRRLSAILTLRSDFLPDTYLHPALNRAIANCQVLVPLMSREELHRCITTPATQAGRPLDAGIVNLLLLDVEGRQGALPLLQFALALIWDGLSSGRAPERTLEAMGGVGGALAGEAEKIYLALDERDRRIARRAFLSAVQLGEGSKDTRRRVAVSELIALTETTEGVLRVLRAFSQAGVRLLTLSISAGREHQVELTHEALFDHWQRLRDWIEKGREDLRFRRRFSAAVAHWNEHGRLKVHLWRPPDLDALKSFRARAEADMTDEDIAFLTAAELVAAAEFIEEQRRSKAQVTESRLRRIIAVAAMLVGVLIGIIITEAINFLLVGNWMLLDFLRR